MRVSFFYSDNCPSHDEALNRLRTCVDAENVDVDIEIVKVETVEDAERLKFIGSPTIMVNGRDIDTSSTCHYDLTCRAYHLEDGRISPLPSEAMILKAIREAKAKES